MRLLIQIIVMLTDLFLLAAVGVCFIYGGLIFGVLAFAMVHYANKPVGGWFAAWKPKNIKAFRDGWNECWNKKL